MCIKFWSTNLKGRGNSEDIDVDGKIILKWMLRRYDRRVWAGYIWPRIVTRGGLL
jgi:hypothetical protein